MIKKALATIALALMFNAYSQNVSFTLSVEPEDDGQVIAGNTGIKWNETLTGSLIIRYKNTTTRVFSLPGFSEAFQTLKTATLQADLLPLNYNFKFRSINTGFSFGASYLSITEETDAIIKDIDGLYFTYSNERDATLVSPRIGLTFLSQPSNELKISYSAYISPVYYLYMDQKINYDFLNAPAVNSVSRWSSPYFDQNINIDLLKYLRAVMQHSYQRLDFQTMDWNEAQDTMIGKNDVQTINRLRFGGELLIPVKGDTVKLKGGIYWETTKTDSTYWGNLDDSSKFVFSFGTEG